MLLAALLGLRLGSGIGTPGSVAHSWDGRESGEIRPAPVFRGPFGGLMGFQPVGPRTHVNLYGDGQLGNLLHAFADPRGEFLDPP